MYFQLCKCYLHPVMKVFALQEMTVEVEEASDYSSPQPNGNYHFAENFDDPQAFKKKWVLSEAKKEGTDEDIAKYDGKFFSFLLYFQYFLFFVFKNIMESYI